MNFFYHSKSKIRQVIIALLFISSLLLPSIAIAPKLYAAAPNYNSILSAEAAFIASAQTANGAIAIHPDKSSGTWRVLPYDANIAARGMLRGGPAYHAKVKAYMQWYLAHLNWPDYNGVYATVYDYNVNLATGAETSTTSYDSADSYASTFMDLVRDYVTYSGDQQFVIDNKYGISSVGHVMTDPKIMNTDGLTWAKPDYKVKYAMDNSEVYRGLVDASWIATNVWGDSAEASWYSTHAASLRTGYESLWLPNRNMYSTAKHQTGALDDVNWTSWYPASTAQVFPIKDGVIAAKGARANSLWANLNQRWPQWTTCNQSGEPFSEVGRAAATRREKSKVDSYLNGCRSAWPDRTWPYNVRHAGMIAEIADIGKSL